MFILRYTENIAVNIYCFFAFLIPVNSLDYTADLSIILLP